MLLSSEREGPIGASRWVSIGLGVALFLFAFLFALEQIYNFDIWWHLRTGDFILENGDIPTEDPFSFSTPGAAWVPHYWLSDVVFSAVESLAGLDGLIVLKAFLIGATFTVGYWFSVSAGASPLLAAAILGFVVPVARFRFVLRPSIFMMLLAVVVTVILLRFRDRKALLLGILAPVSVLWANLHASFFLVLAFSGALFVDEIWSALRAKDRGSANTWLPAGATAAILVVLALVTLFNPFGLDLHRWVLGDFLAKSVTRSFEIEEHMALQWGDHQGFWILMFALGASLLYWKPRPRLFSVLLFLCTTYLALSTVRFVGMAAVLQGILLIERLHAIWAHHDFEFRLPIWAKVVAGCMLAIFAFAAFNTTFRPDKVWRFGLGVRESRFPIEALQFLEFTNVPGNIFNSWEFGGYVLWADPEWRNFIDGRCLDAQLDLYSELQEMDLSTFEAMVDRLEIKGGLIRQQDRVAMGLFHRSPRFDAYYFDDQAVVYLREDQVARTGSPVLEPFLLVQPEAYDYGYLAQFAASPMAPQVEEELRRAMELAPRAFRPAFLLGVFLQARASPEAIGVFETAIENNPSLALTHFDTALRVGRLALEQGQPAKAVQVLEEAEPFGLRAEGYFLLGTGQYLLQQYDEAETALRESLRYSPDSTEALLNLAWVYRDSGDPEEAAGLFSRIGEMYESTREQAHFGLALSLQDLGNRSDASELWRAFLTQYPNSPWIDQARAHLAELSTGDSSTQ